MTVTASISVRPEVIPDGSDAGLFKRNQVDLERQHGVPPIPDPVLSGTIANRKFETEEELADGDYVLVAFVDELQEVTVDAEGGEFALTFEGQTTADIAYDATAEAVQEALEALSNIDPGDVEVTGGPGGTNPYVVKFAGQYAGVDVAEMTAEDGEEPLEGEDAGVAVTTTAAGSKASAGGKQRYVLYSHKNPTP